MIEEGPGVTFVNVYDDGSFGLPRQFRATCELCRFPSTRNMYGPFKKRLFVLRVKEKK